MRGNAEHDAAAAAHGIAPIDLLVVNLYPFEATVAKGARLRRLHREHRHRRPGHDPRRRQEPRLRRRRRRSRGLRARCWPSMAAHGGATSLELRKALAAKAYARTAAYDAAIAAGSPTRSASERRAWRALRRHAWRRSCATARTRTSGRPSTPPASERPGVATAAQLQGKELSYNNINDTDAAFELVAEFDPQVSPAVAIIKHANPCGVASARRWPRPTPRRCAAIRSAPSAASSRSTARSTRRRRERDRRASSPRWSSRPTPRAEAKAIFAAKKNLRLLTTGGLPDPRAPGLAFRSLAGGFLVQTRDNAVVDDLRAEGRHQARADRRGAGRPACSPSRSPSTSSRTPSSTPRTAPPSASAPAR